MDIFKKLLFTPVCFAGVTAAAQEAVPAVREVQSSSNMLAIMMVIISLVFAFVIYAMGQVLITLSSQVFQKQKTAKIILPALLLFALSIKTSFVQAQTEFAEEIVKVLPNYGGLSATAFWSFVVVITIEVIAILVILLFIKRMQEELSLENEERVQAMHVNVWWNKSLPPWFKYGFLITIIFSVIYLLNFHVIGSGKNPSEEYQAEMQKAQEQKKIYDANNKDKIDESRLEMAPAAGIAEGKVVYEQVCWTCHGKAGEGGAGPNLTDDYWLHKGSLTAIYHSIKIGYPDKGMQAWGKMYTPKQIANIASYIKTLHGTKPPNEKVPEGEIFTEKAEPIIIKDSTAVTKDIIPAT